MEKMLIEMKKKRTSKIAESEKLFNVMLEEKTEDNKVKYEAIEKEIKELETDIANTEKMIERKVEKEIVVEDVEDKTEIKEDVLFENYLKGLNEDITNGSVLAPTDVEANVVKLGQDTNLFMTIADVRTASHDLDIPVETSIGASGWLEDGGFTTANIALSSKSMKSYALGRNIVVKRSIVEDSSINLAEYVFDAFGRSNSKLMESAFFTGDGSGKPTGIITEATDSYTAAVGTFTYGDLKALYFSLKEAYRKNGVFIFNEAILQLISEFKDGNGNYIFNQNEPITKIWGKPVYTSEYMDDNVATGNLVALFGDFKYYRVQLRNGIGVEVLKEKNAPDYTYLIYQRVDGKLLVADAVHKLVVA